MIFKSSIQNIDEGIEFFLESVRTTVRKYYANRGYDFAVPDVKAECGSKFAKIIRFEEYPDSVKNHHAAMAFIALTNFENKQLGVVKAGDVFKPASYKMPAKHARGNVFSEFKLTEPGEVPYLR
jgi:hypothetical protein